MKFRIIGEYKNRPFEMTADEIDEYIKGTSYCCDIRLMDYLRDETGIVCGIKALADWGYYGWKEFTLKVGETYTFYNTYISIDGPTDWEECDYKVILQLIEE